MKELETYSIDLFFQTFLWTIFLILLGTIIRNKVGFLQRIYMPASIIGGVIGLILSPQVLGIYNLGTIDLKEIYSLGKSLPGYLIIVVFAGLMLGKKIPKLKHVWTKSSPSLFVGYGIAWGQYIVGIIITLVILMPIWDANPLNSMLIVIGFQGGYGTAAGLGNTYAKLGFDNGYELALGVATAGKVFAIAIGLILINMAVYKRQLEPIDKKKAKDIKKAVSKKDGDAAVKVKKKEKYYPADALLIHFGLLVTAIFIGWFLREGLLLLEGLFLEDVSKGFVQFVPLFPIALIGGIILQVFLEKIKVHNKVNKEHIGSISHSFLDMLIVVAIATLNLSVLAQSWQILALLIGGGLAWNLFVFFVIAPFVYKDVPWVRGVGDFAHATGAATTGLLLMKIVDPSDETGAKSSFNIKQSFYEPIIGGGFITALALPLVAIIGLNWALIIFTTLLLFTCILGYKTLAIKKKNAILDSD